MYNLITNKTRLEKPCVKASPEEGDRIGKILLSALSSHKNGVGLAANQIGINKRVCVVNVNKPIVLVNPKIAGHFGKFLFKEGCLSFPGDYIVTERFTDIAVKADNHATMLYFSARDSALECVCVQHEIDHLNGITMYERQKGEIDGED